MYAVAIDIGTSKTAAVIGHYDENQQLQIKSFTSFPLLGDPISFSQTGVEYGRIVDIDAAVHSIKKVVEDANMLSGLHITGCYAGISGSDVSCHLNTSMVTLSNNPPVVSESDVIRAIHAAKTTAMTPADARVLHTIPHEFLIDGAGHPILKPVNLSANRLDAKVQIICCKENFVRNMETCFNQSGLVVDGLIFNLLAESHALLDEEAQNNGVCLVKIGAGITELGVFYRGKLKHYKCFYIGGNHVTSDILSAVHSSHTKIEEIKIRQGCAKSQLTHHDEVVRFMSPANDNEFTVMRSSLADIIEPRYSEIFNLVNKELEQTGYKRRLMGGGIVLTGGAARIQGAAELATEVLRLPIRLGRIRYNIPNMPAPEYKYTTALGILIYGLEHTNNNTQPETTNISRFKGFLGDFFKRTKRDDNHEPR